MAKTLKISDETHQLLIRVAGEYTSKLGKRMTLDEAISELIREHYKRVGSLTLPTPEAKNSQHIGGFT